jgi:hypothetical protein
MHVHLRQDGIKVAMLTVGMHLDADGAQEREPAYTRHSAAQHSTAQDTIQTVFADHGTVHSLYRLALCCERSHVSHCMLPPPEQLIDGLILFGPGANPTLLTLHAPQPKASALGWGTK